MIGRAQPPASVTQYVGEPTLCGYTPREVLDLESDRHELLRQRQQLRARVKSLEAALREIAEEPTLQHFRKRLREAIEDAEGLTWACFVVRREELEALEKLLRQEGVEG